MNVTLLKLSIHTRLSEETRCFTADIVVDGKVIGEVENRGNGGCNMYFWKDRKAGEALQKFAEQKYPQYTFEQIDSLIEDIIVEMELAKQLKRWCVKDTVIKLKEHKEEDFIKVRVPYSPIVAQRLRKEYGNRLVEIINERFLPKA